MSIRFHKILQLGLVLLLMPACGLADDSTKISAPSVKAQPPPGIIIATGLVGPIGGWNTVPSQTNAFTGFCPPSQNPAVFATVSKNVELTCGIKQTWVSARIQNYNSTTGNGEVYVEGSAVASDSNCNSQSIYANYIVYCQ